MKRHADHCHIHFQDKGEDPCYIAGTVVVLLQTFVVSINLIFLPDILELKHCAVLHEL